MAFFLAALAGFVAVIQSGINKTIAQSWGFSSALLLNGLIFLLFNLVLFGAVYLQPQWFQREFLIQGHFSAFKWWWVIPGFFGFVLVTCLAISLSRIGAVQTFLMCIAAQMVCSALWDSFVENKAVTALRLLGVGITFVGVLVASLN